jgi:hypothetical protein
MAGQYLIRQSVLLSLKIGRVGPAWSGRRHRGWTGTGRCWKTERGCVAKPAERGRLWVASPPISDGLETVAVCWRRVPPRLQPGEQSSAPGYQQTVAVNRRWPSRWQDGHQRQRGAPKKGYRRLQSSFSHSHAGSPIAVSSAAFETASVGARYPPAYPGVTTRSHNISTGLIARCWKRIVLEWSPVALPYSSYSAL